MKVGIDGVLLGAWADVRDCCTILDIGTGTGLIALMLAQRSKAEITAIEIEKNAAEAATVNVAASPWKERVKVEHISLQEFAASNSQQFDLIVSNPPFFQNSFKAASGGRTLARHNDSLPFSTLCEITSQLLTEQGRCAFIVPVMVTGEIETLARKNGLFLQRKTLVIPNEKKAPNRVLLEMGKIEIAAGTDNITIYNNDGSRTEAFKKLTCDFYLKY